MVGGSIGGLVLALAVVIAIAYPSEVVSGDFSETDAALLTLFELQFISISTMFEPITITTRLFDHFERFRPPNASLGFLYLLPILFLYRGGKFLTRRHGTDGDTLSDSALVGTSIAVGYFPVMLGAALAVPSEPVAINVTDAAVKAGILYPVLFGGMGGLVGATYPRGALRKGQAYAIGVTLLSVALVFGSTYLSIEAVPEAADALLGRLFATFFALHGALTLDLTASGMGLLPYLVVGVLFAGAGYRLVAGNDAVETPIDAFVAGTALTPTYLVAGGLLFTGAALVGTPYLFVEEVPEAYLVVRAATESGALGVVFTEGRGGVFFLLFSSIGEFVESLLLSALAYPVALGGGGGLFALRQRTDSNRQTSPQAQTRQ